MRQKYQTYLQLASTLMGIYSRAESFHLTHDRILELKRTEIYETPSYHRLTRYEMGYLQGISEGLSSSLWRHSVVWRLGPAAKPLAEDATDRWDGGPLTILCRVPGALWGGHFWKGTNIPFTAYQPTNENGAYLIQGELTAAIKRAYPQMSSCCVVAYKLGGHHCPICRKAVA